MLSGYGSCLGRLLTGLTVMSGLTGVWVAVTNRPPGMPSRSAGGNQRGWRTGRSGPRVGPMPTVTLALTLRQRPNVGTAGQAIAMVVRLRIGTATNRVLAPGADQA